MYRILFTLKNIHIICKDEELVGRNLRELFVPGKKFIFGCFLLPTMSSCRARREVIKFPLPPGCNFFLAHTRDYICSPYPWVKNSKFCSPPSLQLLMVGNFMKVKTCAYFDSKSWQTNFLLWNSKPNQACSSLDPHDLTDLLQQFCMCHKIS